jgi:sterol-4alpha-carboxylate 3-dehydrogenase (decarboxylating)
MRSVVTGSSGFVGKHLVRALAARGDDVVAMDVVAARDLESVPRVTQTKADLRDSAALRGVVRGADAVFHVASRVQTREAGADEVFAINVGGTRNLIAACRDENVGKLVYTSSASVVYAGRDIELGDESLPYPASFHAPYAETKAIAEREVLGANDARVRTCAIRPHIVFGPGDTRFFPAIWSRAKAGKLKAYVGDWDKLSDFTYVDNLVDGMLLAEHALGPDGKAAGQAYFVTNGEPTSFWEFVGRVLDGLGFPRPKLKVPFPIAYGAAAFREALDAARGIPTSEESLTRFAIRYLTTHHYFTHAKATRDLGYAPKVDLAEGIRRTVASMRDAAPAPGRAASGGEARA